jgi:putative tricarboxylic transport membrane protein
MRTLRLLTVVLMAALVGSASIALGGAPMQASRVAAQATTECTIEGYPTENLQIMAPAAPGGGWDTTSREMQGVLQSDVVDATVEVFNVEGAGGTIGIAQLVNDEAGNENLLMMMGLVMIGAIQLNQSEVTLEQVTPIASLTSEQEAIVVPASSEYESLEQLVEDWKSDPASISWGGGSAGGTDHILVGLMAQAAGIDPSGINYVAHAGGGEAVSAILSGAVTAGVSGVSEFADQVEAGEMRWLAVSGEAAPEGIESPTIQEAGLDVTLENWRGVVAPPEIDDADRDAIVGMITEMHDSPTWQTALEDNGWADFFQTGDEFATYLEEERTRVEGVLQDIGLID